jgi:hypothetical protein
MNQRHTVIDPFVIAVPTERAELQSYLDGLATWLPSLARRRDECSCFEAALPILVEEGLFPTHEALKSALATATAVEYSSVDLLRMVGELAAREPFFEHFIKRRAALGEATIDPSETISRLGNRLAQATRMGLMLAAVAHESGWCPEETYWATRSWNGAALQVLIVANVELVEHLDGTLEQLNRTIETELKVALSPDDVEVGRSIVDIYRDPARAVAMLLARLRRSDSSLPAGVTVLAGPNFLASLEREKIHRQPGVLESVYERALLAALGRLSLVKGAKLHPVRVNIAGDAGQVTRGDHAKLWRCMVTKAGAGYRLHYWQHSNGDVELDEMLVESEC